MVIIAIVAGLLALVAGAGWIVPLILGIVGRRRQWPGARAWRILAIVWGAAAALLACGVGALVFIASQVRDRSAGADAAALFDPAAAEGQTGRLRLAATDAVECVFQDAAGKAYRCASSNGILTVPSGAPTLRQCTVTAADATANRWTASFRSWDNIPLDLDAGAATNVGFGPPFLVAAQVEYAPVSSKISLAPVCADRAGNIYRINSGSAATVPAFQLLDAGRKAVWSGKFEAG